MKKTKILICMICVFALVLGGAWLYLSRTVPLLCEEEPWSITWVSDRRSGESERITEEVNKGKLLLLLKEYERKNMPHPLEKEEFEAAQIEFGGKEGEKRFFVLLGQENKICYLEGNRVNGYEILEGEKLLEEVSQLIDERIALKSDEG